MRGRSLPEVAERARARIGGAEAAWVAEYLGASYRRAMERGLARVSTARGVVLKTDLWNECVGGPRDVLGRLAAEGRHRLFAAELSHARCLEARRLVPNLLSVAANIAALPFREGCIDLLLDLSTIDHLPEDEIETVLSDYARVLRRGGVLVLVSWQNSALVRIRLWLKRCLGIREDPGQHYHRRANVRGHVARELTVAEEFAAGALLVLPMRATHRALTVLPRRLTAALLGWLVRLEHGSSRVLPRLSGLYGLIAVKGLARPSLGGQV